MPSDRDDLPDDLALLAERLADEAEYLASRYPARGSEDWLKAQPEPSVSFRRRFWVAMGTRVAAAAAMVAVGIIGVWGLSSPGPLPFPKIPVTAWNLSWPGPVPLLEIPEVNLAAQPTWEIFSDVRSGSDRPSIAPALVVPAGFFEELSGPEQEALLDLMEIKNLDQRSLSI